MALPIDDSIRSLGRGGFVVVVDDVARDVNANLVIAAEWVTPESMAFLMRYSTGMVGLVMPADRIEALGLAIMAPGEGHGPTLGVPVTARHGTSNGGSARDRATTVGVLIDEATSHSDLIRPGFVFPIAYRNGGVLLHAFPTEAALDLVRLSGCYPAGVLAQLVNDDGSEPQLEDIKAFTKSHRLSMVTITEVVRYRRRWESTIARTAKCHLPMEHGAFTLFAYRGLLDGNEHLAFTLGETDLPHTPVSVHLQCFVGDVFRSPGCDCRKNLDRALSEIAAEGRGVMIYLGTGANSILTVNDHSPAESDMATAEHILRDLGVHDAVDLVLQAGQSGFSYSQPAGYG